jgi:hypothetical protein
MLSKNPDQKGPFTDVTASSSTTANSTTSIEPANRARTAPCQYHTHVQQVAAGIPVYREGEAMTLDRGTLAKIDRRVLAELDHGEGVQLVKVPLSNAVWSTWRRYCQALGLTMGAGIAALITHELGGLVEASDQPGAVFDGELQRRLLTRIEALDAREQRLDERERSLRSSERLLRARVRPLDLPDRVSVGRNDPCPCRSGFKYKRCHGN